MFLLFYKRKEKVFELTSFVFLGSNEIFNNYTNLKNLIKHELKMSSSLGEVSQENKKGVKDGKKSYFLPLPKRNLLTIKNSFFSISL